MKIGEYEYIYIWGATEKLCFSSSWMLSFRKLPASQEERLNSRNALGNFDDLCQCYAVDFKKKDTIFS